MREKNAKNRIKSENTITCSKKLLLVGKTNQLLANTATCWRKPSLVGENHHLLGEPSLVGRTITCWRKP